MRFCRQNAINLGKRNYFISISKQLYFDYTVNWWFWWHFNGHSNYCELYYGEEKHWASLLVAPSIDSNAYLHFLLNENKRNAWFKWIKLDSLATPIDLDMPPNDVRFYNSMNIKDSSFFTGFIRSSNFRL